MPADGTINQNLIVRLNTAQPSGGGGGGGLGVTNLSVVLPPSASARGGGRLYQQNLPTFSTGVSDLFARTVAPGGWGSADVGGAVPLVAGLGWGSDYEFTFQSLSAGAQTTALNQMKAAGVTWLRFDIPYTTTPGTWLFDPEIIVCLAAGFKVIALMTEFNVHVGSPSTMATFATLVANHYGPMGVTQYEVGNELNLGSGGGSSPLGTANSTQYAAMYKSCYSAIKAVSSTYQVSPCGIAPAATNGTDISPLDWLNALYTNSCVFDWLSMHPYCQPLMPMDNVTAPGSNAFYNMPNLRASMVANGDSAKLIWFTEFGYPTKAADPANVTEAFQAAGITAAFNQIALWPWVGPTFIFNWQDSADGGFGMIRNTNPAGANGTAKPALASLTNRAGLTVGGTWSVVGTGTAANFSVNGTAGQIALPSTVPQPIMLQSMAITEMIRFDVSIAALPSAGNFVYIYAWFRIAADLSSYYRIGMYLDSAGTLCLRGEGIPTVTLFPDATPTAFATFTPYTPGAWISVKAQLSTAGPTACAVKAWPQFGTEPAFQVTGSDPTSIGPQGAGFIGLRATASGDAINVQFDNYQAVLI